VRDASAPNGTEHALDTAQSAPPVSDVVVVGAGVIGVWTAYWSLRGGATAFGDVPPRADVTLLDAWGCGHPRATSGDETRILHLAHGADPLLTAWANRARAHWRVVEDEWKCSLFSPTGVLWWAHESGSWEDRSLGVLEGDGVPAEKLDLDDVRSRWPAVAAEDLAFALFEPEGGVLHARTACRSVAAAFQRSGGCFALAAVVPGRATDDRLLDVVDRLGNRYAAETFVFACGPWLPKIFPDVVGSSVRVTKQDVILIGISEEGESASCRELPPWIDRKEYFYGIPSDVRGFKIGANRLGPEWDPSNGERVVDPDSIRLARRYLRTRLPSLEGRPVVETRVCQYETTPDENFIIDRHPSFANVWIAGGGSGRAFKHGPSIGEYLVSRMNGRAASDDSTAQRFRLGRDDSQVEFAHERLGDRISANWSLF
jgi:glycine/D-amino acid oxidase-like deaminating enzyme